MFITIVASAPTPSPFIGTLVYVVLGGPTWNPLSLIRIVFNCPLVKALFLIDWYSIFVSQSEGTGIKSIESNLTRSIGEIVYKYFQIYPSPLLPADLGSKSVNFGSSKEGFPLGFSGSVPLLIQMYTLKSLLITK